MFEELASSSAHWSAGLGWVGPVTLQGGLAAVATGFPLMCWPGRAHYDGHRLRHRVIVYDRATRDRRAVLDVPRFPVHELAFREDGGALAIACGSYDGGYSFEGELLVWEWATGAIRRPLGLNREVMRVRWIDERRLAVLLRPATDEAGDQAFSQRHGLELVDDDKPLERRALTIYEGVDRIEAFGFTTADPPECAEHQDWILAGGLTPQSRRTAIRDIAFVGERIAALDDDCLVSLWDSEVRQVSRIVGEGRGVQLLRAAGQTIVAAHGESGSLLYRLDGATIRELRRFDRDYLFSTDTQGHILARDTGRSQPRRDLVLDAEGSTLHARDLGHFDVFNHSLRLDGDERLYFLRGSPPSQHRDKVLASITGDGEVHEVMRWDRGGAHLMDPCACMVDGGALVMGAREHHPHPGKGDRFVARRGPDGALQWRVDWTYAPVAMAYAPAAGLVLVATLDGTLAGLDAQTGALRGETTLRLDGVLAPPTCIAVDDQRAALGTLDGRLVTVSLTGGVEQAQGPERRRGPPVRAD